MTHPDPSSSDPRALDRRWQMWSTIAVLAVVLSGIFLGVLIIPVVQGHGVGLDAFTAICRALGIQAGSPARLQPTTQAPPTPVSQVVWTPDVLQILARADAMERRESPSRPNFPTWQASRGRLCTSNCPITAAEAACIQS